MRPFAALVGIARSQGIVVAAATLVLGCRLPLVYDVKPGLAPRCADDVCLEVVHFESAEEAFGVWLEAPPATRLLNARFAIDDEPACGGHVPVEWVRVDREVHRHGPVDVGGNHGLVLDFPRDAWFAHHGYWRDTFVDVELEVAGKPRCVRTRLTRGASGKLAVGQ
ncbi:MAG TPA: hypothetical protein VHL80_07280 [Polyangia bacterium]|nr:hypothetical protein [Polyangia bacterium]